MLKSFFLVCLLMTSVSTVAKAAEGYFDPQLFPLQNAEVRKQAIASVVRIKSKLFLHINVFDRQEDARTWMLIKPQLDDDGTATMNLAFLSRDIGKCADPMFYNQPGQFEFCKSVKTSNTWPQLVHFEGGATGSFISSDGYILTNYHVAMWCIKKARREDGVFQFSPSPCANISVEVFDGYDNDGNIRYETINNVELVANSSMEETWPSSGPLSMRLDVAILKVNYQPQSYFKFRTNRPARFEKILMLGHPIRSQRNPERLRLLGYKDADNSLRISVGFYLSANSEDTFLSDLDGGPGNSGSPTLDSEGDLIGLLSTSVGEKSSVPVAYGGFNPQHVLANSICKRFEIASRFPSIEGCDNL